MFAIISIPILMFNPVEAVNIDANITLSKNYHIAPPSPDYFSCNTKLTNVQDKETGEISFSINWGGCKI